MLDNFIICLRAVIPLFITMFVGFLVKRSRIVTSKDLSQFNKMVFCALFPFLMFDNIYKSEITEVINGKLVVYTLISIGLIYAFATLFVRKTEKADRNRGAMIQAIYRSNYVILGLPISINIFGSNNVGLTAVLAAIVVPIYNVLAVITLEKYRGGKADLKDTMINIAKNPLILGAAVGVLFSLLHITLPAGVESAVSGLSSAATPVVLVILGASFRLSSARKDMNKIIVCVISRLIIVPGIFLTAAALLGFKDIAFVTLVGIFASPCAVSSFPMAQQMGSNGELAGETVIISTALSCVTLFGWLFLFKSLGMF